MKNIVFAISCVLAFASAWAQPAVGSLANVNGLVTITQNNQLVTVGNGATFADGARIVATVNSRVTVRMANGCDVRLAPNQSFTVDNSQTNCTALQATVTNLPPPPGGPVFAGAGFSPAQLSAFAFIGWVAYQSVSPR